MNHVVFDRGIVSGRGTALFAGRLVGAAGCLAEAGSLSLAHDATA